MKRSKGIITAAGTLACAAGIGFFMQSGDPRYDDRPVLATAGAANAVLDVQDITLTSADLEDNGTQQAALDPLETPMPAPMADVVTASANVDDIIDGAGTSRLDPAINPSCEISASGRAVAAAMVDLSLDAPCFANERVTIHHNGMVFTETTSATGTLGLTVPALSTDAVFIMAFPNGEGAVAQANVEELDDFHRVVLQWKGETGFEIHAREFGANYGAEGHIWHGAPGDLVGAVTGSRGMMTRHGDFDTADPLVAEVYSFPASATAMTGSVALSVEAEVTPLNCGIEIEAQSLERGPDGQITTQNLTLPVPDCAAEGSFLVLNNLLDDLKIAAN